MQSPAPLWIFGYGSLIWRPAFAFDRREPASVVGWRRRFWQASPDHRGTPEAPGRVVTLVPEAGAVVDGMAYRVEPSEVPAVLDQLDDRESGGYDQVRISLDFHRARGSVDGLVYVASARNPNFRSGETEADIVRTVHRSHGQSGANREYVLELARALRDLGFHDPHVFAIEARLRDQALRED